MRLRVAFVILAVLTLTACGRPQPTSSLEAFSAALGELSAADRELLEEVPRYHLSLVLDPEKRLLTGQATIHYTNVAAGELREVYLRLYPNMRMYGGRMTTVRATVGGRDVPFVEMGKGADLKIPLPQTLATHQSAAIVIDYSLVYPESAGEYDFFGVRQGIAILPECYPVLAPLIDGEWRLDPSPGFGDAAYTDLSLYRVEVTAPAQYTVIAPGVLTDWKTTTEGVTRTFVSGPTRTVGLVAGKGYQAQELKSGSVTLTGYSLAGDASSMRAALSHAAAVQAFCSQNLGPYRGGALTLVQVPLEHSDVHLGGMALINQPYFDELRTEAASAVSIAVSREWWGRLVAFDPLRDPWLDEALATYTSYLYLRQSVGSGGTESIVQAWNEAYNEAVVTGQNSPLRQPLSAYGNSTRYELLVHSQGPLFWRDMESLLGESGLLVVLRDLQQSAAFGHLDTAALVASIARLAGEPGLAVADAWGLTTP